MQNDIVVVHVVHICTHIAKEHQGSIRPTRGLGPLFHRIRTHPRASAHNNQIMSANQPSFRWRTVLEVTFIVSVIYVFLGAPGLNNVLTSGKKDVIPAPKIHLRPDSLVYPDLDLDCSKHKYDVHIFSASPLIIYIDGFLSGEEADALVELR